MTDIHVLAIAGWISSFIGWTFAFHLARRRRDG